MLKYIERDLAVTFSEVPDEITLCLNISNCQNHCKNCHSPYLAQDIGKMLTIRELRELINTHDGITCVCFMGEGNDMDLLIELARFAKDQCGKKVAVYSGRTSVEDVYYQTFNYIKVGPYKEEYGGLNKRTTNQHMYMITDGGEKIDITYKFWK